ncbi:MAG: TRAFs-binding domain-containing protein [Gaiellaceae bacterium]
MTRPLCFVLMPFGKKPDDVGNLVDFDAVYREFIAPAIEEAGLQPIRADEELTGGIIHKPMYERLILCEFAVADLTTANANVFYELGVRHATRPWSTVLVFAAGGRLPFDVALLRAIPYELTSSGLPADAEAARAALVERLVEAREAATDSPIFQLVDGLPAPQLDREKTDVFREQVRYSTAAKERLAQARGQGVDALKEAERELEPIEDAESGVAIDLFLSYRAVKAYPEMIALVEKMSPPLAATAMVQEQLGFALNRDGQRERAESVLKDLIDRRGPSSETYGLLGRVYKDQWEAAKKGGEALLARGFLKKAIDAYLKGFEADWRDAYPGINVVTLMEVAEPPDPRREKLIPVVAYAVERRIARGEPDYWDHASRLELAVLGQDEATATTALTDALAAMREVWEPETTAKNLGLIRETRAARGLDLAWADEAEQALLQRAKAAGGGD